MDAVIEIKNLNKVYAGGTTAVSGLDLQVQRGSIYGLIGRNGAGKTTTLRCLMGLIRPDSGQANILGHHLLHAPRELRQQVAYVSQTQQLPGWMNLSELFRYTNCFYNHWDMSLALHLAKEWEIPGNRPVSMMSAGQQRLTSVLLAFASRPRVLLLDEPAAGLDPVVRRSLLSSLVRLVNQESECTVLFSSHLISDLQRIADTIGIMDRGRLTDSMKLEVLLDSTKRVQVVFESEMPPPGFQVPGARRSETSGPVVTAVVNLTNDEQLDPVRRLKGARINIFPMGLEEIFVELFHPTQDSPWPETPSKSKPSESPALNINININN